MTDFRRFFEVLGLPYCAAQEDVRNAYRSLTSELEAAGHGAPPTVQEELRDRLKALDEAYMLLISAAWQAEEEEERRRDALMNTGQLNFALQQVQQEALHRALDNEPVQPIQAASDADLEHALLEAQEEAVRRAQDDDPESAADAAEDERVEQEPPGYVAATVRSWPRQWLIRWAVTGLVLAGWLALSLVLPLSRGTIARDYESLKKDEWTLENRHKELYDAWLAYQAEKEAVLSRLLGRPLAVWEADKWRPPYSLDGFRDGGDVAVPSGDGQTSADGL